MGNYVFMTIMLEKLDQSSGKLWNYKGDKKIRLYRYMRVMLFKCDL